MGEASGSPPGTTRRGSICLATQSFGGATLSSCSSSWQCTPGQASRSNVVGRSLWRRRNPGRKPLALPPGSSLDVLCLSSSPLRNDPTRNPWLGCWRSVLHILYLLPSRLRDVRHRGLCEGDQLNHTPSSLALNLGVLMLCPLCLLVYLVQNISTSLVVTLVVVPCFYSCRISK